MLGLALMSVHSLMVGLLFLVVPRVTFLSEVLSFLVLGSWGLGTMWLSMAYTSLVVFSKFSFS